MTKDARSNNVWSNDVCLKSVGWSRARDASAGPAQHRGLLGRLPLTQQCNVK